MAELTLTNIEDRLLEAMALRAKATGQTVEETARELIELGFKLDPKGRVAASDYIRGMQRAPLTEDSTTPIKQDRDGVSENTLSPEEALELTRGLRKTAPRKIYPDSTPGIRADRDAR